MNTSINNHIEAYIKYNYFDKEQREREKAKPPFHTDNLYYNPSEELLLLPDGPKNDFYWNKD